LEEVAGASFLEQLKDDSSGFGDAVAKGGGGRNPCLELVVIAAAEVVDTGIGLLSWRERRLEWYKAAKVLASLEIDDDGVWVLGVGGIGEM
jgi:hypothetical protein